MATTQTVPTSAAAATTPMQTYSYAPQPAPISSAPLPSQLSFPGPPATFDDSQTAPATFEEQMSSPAYNPSMAMANPTTRKLDLKGSKSSAEFGLREFMSLQRRRYTTDEIGMDERLRLQAETVRADLRVLRRNVAEIIKAAEAHRWRHWLVGGVIGTFIPAVTALFRRPKEERGSSNDTEYAFQKSKTMIRRILDLTSGRGGLISVAFFVFAVLYVFQNEVSLRVARTVHKRLKRLSSKVERGTDEITEQDMKLLQGWRWRVLLWAS